MITKEKILEYIREESYKPLGYKELLDVFDIKDSEDETRFSKYLGQLEKEGEIVKTRKNKYGLPEMMHLVKGVLLMNPRGYGIVKPDRSELPEVFIFGKKINGAMHNDKVMVRIYQKGSKEQRPEGTVVRAISRANKQIVGTFEKGKHLNQVIPDDPKLVNPIYVKPSRKFKAASGEKVVVNITGWPDKNKAAEGKIVEILGKKGQPGLDVQVVIKKHGLRDVFPEQVIEEAKEVARPINDKDMVNRRDLRNLPMVTIDGEDAKDLDDAVSIERINNGYRLGVHIADVSHYVKDGSKLDKEAFKRGTSVYLIDKVLPMLPAELSNNICSLNANQDRLAISCIMDIDEKGSVHNYDLFKSVINVNQRMTYTEVNKILNNDDKLIHKYSALVEDFQLMQQLAAIIRKDRKNRGALDFDFPEAKVIVDENSVPVDIKRFERGEGERLIEDFMIKANEVVAEHLYWQEASLLYRVHEKPEEEAINNLNRVLGIFGQKIRTQKIEPRVIQKLLEDIKGKPGEQMIATLTLRSMKHARYFPHALGHFGLASKFYCHFTSPIRRYPDLIVHRVLTALFDGTYKGRKKAALEKKMPVYGENSTAQEIKAEEAERELVDIKKAQYMHQFLGQEFTARIVSVQSFGFFVALENTVEGLVHISSITDDYYEFNEYNYSLIGSHSGRKFAIGDTVRVVLVRVLLDEAKIDFELVE